MEREKTIDVLKSWGSENTYKLAAFLNLNHIVSDEDDLGLSSTMVENWTEECDSYLKEHGYIGGRIRKTGKFYPNLGAAYVLFNESEISYEGAMEYLNAVAKRDVENYN